MKTQIEIFKAGKHTAMNGTTLTFSDADLQAAAAAYDPAVYEAPLVVGHPKIDAPAYGWAKSIHFADDGKLVAEPHQVDAEFSEIVQAGRYKKISAAFFAPDAENNPKPGVWYLKHIGFLGAAAPAVKGLKSVSFSEDNQGVYEFADWDQLSIANLFRRIREMVIAKFGIEDADKHLPEYEINSLQINAAQHDDDRGGHKPYFSEPDQPKDDDMTPEQKAKMEALEAENKTLKDKETAFAEAQAAEKTKAINAGNVAFAESLTQAGKLLPAHKDVLVAALNVLDAPSATVEFGEAEAKVPLSKALKTVFEALPKQVEFGEHAGNEKDDDAVAFAAPHGFDVDVAGMDTHQKALAYQKANNTDYLVAVQAVAKS